MAKQFICPTCHHIGKPAYKKRGSLGGDIRAWMVFPLGVPYTLWRMFSKEKVCKSCGGAGLIDEHSAVGLRLMAQLDKGTFSSKPYDRPQTLHEKPVSPIAKIHSKDHQF